ncbi:hypothetical protein [Flavobacterium xinjiangense]|uniref:Outer membrane protein X n=1 Tax=Flavobacterium xinjiangense TaxID=178356 RepID=A0A1M7NLR3_9FLAO|nr:hypothetical protein [Flavobacterium xinjiangense]SHN04689.1 outer membrane protein X [Flavobacterium xinjiangense]
MKKVILAVATFLVFTIGYSQKEGGFRVGLDFGFVPAQGGAGLLFSIEPKYNIKDNMNVGLRIGGAGIVRDVNDSGTSTSAKVSANSSYVATYDYYFNKSGKTFVPYIGGGAGFYTVGNVQFDDINSSNNVTLDATSSFGGLVRGGFEWGKFRMGVEYNLVPESTLHDMNGNNRGTVSNTYLGIHLGFYVGGGKWGK